MQTIQLAALLVGFWLILIAPPDVAGAVTGAVVALAAAVAARRLVWAGQPEDVPYLTPGRSLRLLAYIPYLVTEIVKAAIGVAEKVIDPRMPIDPLIITYRVPLERTVSIVALANSITLTPGTLTVDVEGSTLTVHALGTEFADDLLKGELARRVGHVFEGD